MNKNSLEYDKLLKEYQQLQLRVTQFSNVEQELINTRDRLDQELLLYKRLNRFNSEALKDISYENLIRIGTEAIVDIFETESSLIFIHKLNDNSDAYSSSSVFITEGLDISDQVISNYKEELFLLSERFASNKAHLLNKNHLEGLSYFSLFSRGLFFHFTDNELGIQGFLFGLISKEYDPIYKQLQGRHETIFSIFSQQFISLISNRKKSKRIKSQLDLIASSEQEMKKLSLIATKTVNGVVISDALGKIEWVNEGFTKITGYSLDEVKGKKPKDFLQGPETKKEHLEKLSEALQNKRSIELTIINYNKKNEPYYNLLQIAPVFDNDGNHIHFIALQRDITSEINAQQEILNINSRFELITQKAFMGIWEWDVANDRTIWNDIQYQLYGAEKRSSEKDFFNYWTSFLNPDDKDRVVENFKVFLHSKGELLEDEFSIIRGNDGETRTIKALLIAERNAEGKLIRLVGTSVDITDIKNNEHALQHNLKQQEVLSDISLELNAIEDFNSRINAVLNKIGTHTNVSRVYIFENSNNDLCCSNTFEWCNDGVEPQISNLQEIPYEVIPYWKKTLNEKGVIYSESIIELPQEVRDILEPQGIKSIIVYPLYLKGSFNGFIGFDECFRNKKWTKSELELLRAVSGIISNAYEKNYSELSLIASEAKYRSLIENMNLGLVETDTNNNIIFSNKKFNELISIENPLLLALGINQEEQLNKLLKEDVLQGFNRLDDKVFELYFIDRQKKKKYFLVSCASTFDQQNNLSGNISIYLDITRVKILQQELEDALTEKNVFIKKINSLKLFYESVLNHAPSEIAVLNPDLQLTFSNHHFMNTKQPWKLQLKKGLEQDADGQIYNHTSDTIIASINSSVISKKQIQLEENYIDSDGTEKYFLRTILPFYNDIQQLENIILTGVDITDIKQFENNLIRKNEELKKINTELDNFVYSVSHDLRSPLLSIKGILSLVFKSNSLDDKNSNFLKMAESSVLKLDGTIQEILEYSRNSRLDVVNEKVNIKKLVESIYGDLKYSTSEKIKCTINIKGPEEIITDLSRIRTLLNNIIGNSFKYHRNNIDEPFINFELFRDDDSVVMKISDNGEGISEKNIDNIFNMFYRASNKVAGTGLGLYICKEIINKLKGDISVSSKVSEGTAFTIRIPNLSEI